MVWVILAHGSPVAVPCPKACYEPQSSKPPSLLTNWCNIHYLEKTFKSPNPAMKLHKVTRENSI
jgi:hypothetical protein